MIERRRYYKSLIEMQRLGDFKKAIESQNTGELQKLASENPASMTGGLIQAANAVSAKDAAQIDRAVKSFLTDARSQLEKGLTVLATLGSNAPFIGLFGTVLGIIQAFGELSQQRSNTQSVMAGISEALIATAIGLFVAIPAVVAYNVFAKNVKQILSECESLRDFYISRLRD